MTVRKLFIGSINIKTKYNPDIKKGPKGISFCVLDKEQYIAYGKAKKDPNTNETILNLIPRTNPNKTDNFMSPPPIDSCLNILLPI
jgi:hypothetical protein